MKKKSKYGRNPKLNPKTHCVMVRFDDVEWNRFLTMYEESNVYAKAVFLKAHFFGQKFKVLKVDKTLVDYYTPSCRISMPSSAASARTTIRSLKSYASTSQRRRRWRCSTSWRSVPSTL